MNSPTHNKLGHIKDGMLVQVGDREAAVYLGRVAGLKNNFIKLHHRDAPNGQRGSIPGSWVDCVVGHQVHLFRTPSSAKTGWLTQAELKARPADV